MRLLHLLGIGERSIIFRLELIALFRNRSMILPQLFNVHADLRSGVVFQSAVQSDFAHFLHSLILLYNLLPVHIETGNSGAATRNDRHMIVADITLDRVIVFSFRRCSGRLVDIERIPAG